MRQTSHTSDMLRRLADELQAQADQERGDAEFQAEQELRRKEDRERREDERSIAYSLRLIEQHLGQLRMDVANGALRGHK